MAYFPIGGVTSLGLKVGIIGLPNVGKSTLFNAIMGKQAALTAPYPFATIEPNLGVVDVPDERLIKLRDAMFPPNNQQPPLVFSSIQFVDIAGLVKGASEGNGLGNKFLSHIRDVDLILHVLRDFEAEGIPRHQDSRDPAHDAEIVKMELELKDLEILEKKEKKDKGDKGNKGDNKEEEKLLAKKPVIYAVNIGEGKLQISSAPNPSTPLGFAQDGTKKVLFFCAKLEEEISQLSKNEQKDFLAAYGLESSGLDRIIKQCYKMLGLISFLTVGKIEVRAWPLPAGSTAVRASGVIHSDFEKLFIRAEIIEWEKMAQAGSWQTAKEKGWVRIEGRDYVVHDGDVCNFLIGK